MKLYKVTFRFSSEYRHKAAGFVNISLVVEADTQFSALAVAWEKLSGIELPEPVSFDAERCNVNE